MVLRGAGAGAIPGPLPYDVVLATPGEAPVVLPVSGVLFVSGLCHSVAKDIHLPKTYTCKKTQE